MKRNVFVDFSSEKGFVKCQKALYDTWQFSNANIAETLGQYKNCGTIKKCSPEHYTILKELISKHLLQFDSKIAKEAYLASKKAELLTIYNPAGLMLLITFITSILSFLYATIGGNTPAFLICSVFFILLTIATRYGAAAITSPAIPFYSSLFKSIENHPNNL